MDIALQRNDRFYAACMAVGVHVAIFTFGALGLMRGIEYGMDASNGMADVDLIAAPAPAASAISQSSVHVETQQAPVASPEDIAEPEKAEVAPAQPAVKPVPHALLTTTNLSGSLGDGSSPVPGTDATTIHRSGSGGSFGLAGYYRNPPPAYPVEARKLKQQGRVLLEINVTAEGLMAGAKIKESSGFPLLDEAALKGVQNWKFRAATLGGLRVATIAEVPIRFQLK